MKKWGKVLTFATVAMSALTLAACGSKGKDSSASSDKKVVSMYMPGDKPKNYSAMIKAANKEIQKTYPKIELDMKFIGWGEYNQRFSVMVTSGDDYDLAFSQDYTKNAGKGAYADLTELLKTTGKKAYEKVDPAYWKGLTVNGKIYGFPINANVYAQNTIAFNNTFLKKYNLDPSNVKSYDDLEPLLAAFHKENPDVAAFAIGQGFKASPRAMEFPLGNGLPFVVDSDGKDTTVKNVYDTEEMQHILQTLHSYYLKGYIPKDAATASVQYNLGDDTWFTRQETVGPYDYGTTALNNAAGVKDKISIQPITDAYKSEAQAQVAIWTISKTSKHKKEAMQVLNLLNTNPTLLNNIVWGLEGQQWNFADKEAGTIKTTKKYTSGYFIGAWMMGNNDILYTQDTLGADKIQERKDNIAAAKTSAALGFVPDTSKVKTEITNLSNVMSKYLDILNTGTADPIPTIEKMDKELKGAGYDKVQKELQKQYDKFLAENK